MLGVDYPKPLEKGPSAALYLLLIINSIQPKNEG